ncbi:uncharacterized protein Dwil_GK10903 [Drosophila willistoni]|uniref:DUF4776 domain-containing protein n=1 Tax=Drosophila willistoni TaxID=7260 RepID=B4N9I6_DROWI|nr:uncharacterized protein LOC6647463 [Drosophila willistoni]EDW81662.2 uncharacterized protein Dwil_GK10903 [Drosophila willistoni]
MPPKDNSGKVSAMPSATSQKAPPTFLFDMIINQLILPNEKIDDPNRLTVEGKFNSMPVKMTSSRINVTDFVNQRSMEFVTAADKLRKSLEDQGMSISVLYNNRAICTGHIVFPSNYIDRIDEGMSDLMHEDWCELEKNSAVAGKMKFICRLIIKCDDPDGLDGSCARDIDKSIHPKDIFFVMGQPQVCEIPSNPCLDVLEPEEGDERLKLDLDRYRSVSAGRVNTNDLMLDQPAFSAACYDLKKLVTEYGQIIDSVAKNTAEVSTAPQPCVGRPDAPMEMDVPQMPTMPTMPSFVYYTEQKTIPDFPIDGNLAETKPIRFCPVCLTSMSWLPKYACCPHCGIKPLPVVEERLKEKKPTADQILLEYLGKPSDGSINDLCMDACQKAMKSKIEGSSQDDCPPCRCKCKANKMCAHCRIRKVCADIFQSNKGDVEKCPKVEPKDNEDFCILSDSANDCRPYLARVFSELRMLYDINDKNRASEYEDACGQRKKSASKIDGKARKDGGQDVQHIPAVSQPNGTSINSERHKNCLSQHGAVSRNHGWAWPKTFAARKLGWRPGAVRKPIKKIMEYFLESAVNELDELDVENEPPEPVLNVCKKDGAIFITLRPLSTLGMIQKPITFRVVKSDLAVALSEIKAELKEKGFRKCTCHKSVMMCLCRSVREKKDLERAINKECKQRRMQSCAEHLILTDTSESEMEYDFNVTPPAGNRQVAMPRKPRTTNNGTQYSKKDLQSIPTKYPVITSPYYRAFDCATFGRYKAKEVPRKKAKTVALPQKKEAKTGVKRGL